MTFFSKCNSCGKNKFFVKQRKYKVHYVSPKPITSKGELCGKCYRKIKKAINK